MTRTTSDLTKVEVFIFELEFRISLQQEIINAFGARGLRQAEPIELLAQLRASLKNAHLAREQLLQRAAVNTQPAELIEVHHSVSIQPKLAEEPLLDTAQRALN